MYSQDNDGHDNNSHNSQCFSVHAFVVGISVAGISGAEISAGAGTFAEEGIDACPPRPKLGRPLQCKESLDASVNTNEEILEHTQTTKYLSTHEQSKKSVL